MQHQGCREVINKENQIFLHLMYKIQFPEVSSGELLSCSSILRRSEVVHSQRNFCRERGGAE